MAVCVYPVGYTIYVIKIRTTKVFDNWLRNLRDMQAHTDWRFETMARTETQPFDAASYLKTEEDMVAYREAAFEENDPAVVAAALGDIARAKGMTKVAREAGLGRESLYKALSPEGNPELATVMKVVRALGLSLHARPRA